MSAAASSLQVAQQLSLQWQDWLHLFMHYMMLSLLSIGGAISTLPDMHRYLVDQQHWLTEVQFNSAVAIAQASPGPNVLFVALMGWNVGLNAGSYAAALRSGSLLFLSGKAPSPVDGVLPRGKLGREFSAEQGYAFARSAALELIAALRAELGSLDELQGSLNTVPEFEAHAEVLDGASDLLLELFGPACGRHVRSVVGVCSLRKGVPLTLKATVELRPNLGGKT